MPITPKTAGNKGGKRKPPVNKIVNKDATTGADAMTEDVSADGSPVVTMLIHKADGGDLLKFWFKRGMDSAKIGLKIKDCPIPEHELTKFGDQCREAWVSGFKQFQGVST